MKGRQKKVLITINPMLVEEQKFSTMRKMLRCLDEHCELQVAPISGYDFRRGKVRTYKLQRGGKFEYTGLVEASADVWIVYSDGFYLDHSRFGFRHRRDYFQAQLAFHQAQMQAGRVRLMINSPEAEVRTLKSWLATLDFKSCRVIPTYSFSKIEDVFELQNSLGKIVAKPEWGGASLGIELLSDEQSVRDFHAKLKKTRGQSLADFCFQKYCAGDEKRLWFIGGKFHGSRVIRGRETPWSPMTDEFEVESYDSDWSNGFARDVAAAERLCQRAGLNVGSVDFIGSRINEINGGGTVLTTFRGRELIMDLRPAFVRYILDLLDSM
ncbi:MAG TPA: hypothetical protein VM911_03765 [Pyrinomonadaceae bacterium]|nr:hypothetical protein [Pyrinomonadaceae bacterium]